MKDFYPEIVNLYKQNFSCEQIAKKYNCSHENIRYILKKEKVFIPKFIKSKINLDFLLGDSEVKSYFLGLLFSDGHIDYLTNTVVIKLKSTDAFLLKHLSCFIGEHISVNIGESRRSWVMKNNEKVFFTSSPTATLKFNSKEFVNYLSSLGLSKNKTTTLIVPSVLEHDVHFWRGMIDGDGCIYFKGNTVQLTLIGTEEVCKQFKQFCLSHCGNIKSSIRKSGIVYTITICSTKAVKILDALYSESTICLSRKQKIYLSIKEEYQPNIKYLEVID